MLKVKVNNAKNFMPHSVSNGTTEQRFQNARRFNLKFYDLLQSDIKNNEIAQKTFVRRLKEIAGSKLGVDIIGVDGKKDSFMSYSFDSNLKTCGYTLGLPLSFYTEKIHKNSAQTFLKVTQNFFNEAFNPKILKRYAALLSGGFDNTKAVTEFYAQNVSDTSELLPENLAEFLKDKPPRLKIDALQFMRYRLMSEQNTAQASYSIDKSFEKYNDLEFVHDSEYYSLDKYHFDDKLKLLEEKLKEVIQQERV